MNNPRNMGEITEEEAKRIGGNLVVADFGAEELLEMLVRV